MEVNPQNLGHCSAIGKYATKPLALEDKLQVKILFICYLFDLEKQLS